MSLVVRTEKVCRWQLTFLLRAQDSFQQTSFSPYQKSSAFNYATPTPILQATGVQVRKQKKKKQKILNVRNLPEFCVRRCAWFSARSCACASLQRVLWRCVHFSDRAHCAACSNGAFVILTSPNFVCVDSATVCFVAFCAGRALGVFWLLLVCVASSDTLLQQNVPFQSANDATLHIAYKFSDQLFAYGVVEGVSFKNWLVTNRRIF